jgi:hypothetical protein
MYSQLQAVSGDRLLHQKAKDTPRHGYKGLVKYDHSVCRSGSCCWPPPAQSFLVPGLTGPMTIFFCLPSLTANMSDNFIANKYSTHVSINYRQILREILCREEQPILSSLRHIIKLRICQWNVINSSPDTPSNKPSLHVTYTLLRYAVFVQSLCERNLLCANRILLTRVNLPTSNVGEHVNRRVMFLVLD